MDWHACLIASVPTPLDDAYLNMLAHEALMESAETGVWVRL